MDFLSDLLPLLIVGAIYLIGLVAGKKKKPATQQAPRPAQAEAHDVVVPPKKRQKQKQFAGQKQPTPFLNYDLTQNAGSTAETDSILIEEEEEQLPLLTDLQDPEEMRKAIIYSEILTRKF